MTSTSPCGRYEREATERASAQRTHALSSATAAARQRLREHLPTHTHTHTQSVFWSTRVAPRTGLPTCIRNEQERERRAVEGGFDLPAIRWHLESAAFSIIESSFFFLLFVFPSPRERERVATKQRRRPRHSHSHPCSSTLFLSVFRQKCASARKKKHKTEQPRNIREKRLSFDKRVKQTR